MNDIVEQMEMIFDTVTVYFKRSTGKFIALDQEELSFDNCLVEEPEIAQSVAEILADENTGDYVPLPLRYEIYEYAIMKRLCHTVENPKIAKDLVCSIIGKKAYSPFA